MKKPLKTFAFRFDENQMKQAQELDIDLSEVFRHALAQELLKRTKHCPTCGVSGCGGKSKKGLTRTASR